MKKIISTVIGSSPVEGDGQDAIRVAVNDQLEAGIEMISDGQTRKDMVAYFADHIPGFKVDDGRSLIVGKVKPPEETPIPEDLVFARAIAGNKAEVKVSITGPVTLAFFAELSPTAPYRGFRDESLYRDIAEALAVETELIQKSGFKTIQFDEPSYSIGAPMELAKNALERTLEGVKGTRALHVCGNLKRSFSDIVKIEGIDILSFAFKDNFSNFDTVARKQLEDYGKKLGLGCISSQDSRIEDEGTILTLMNKALEAYGPENVAWIHPDCGFRALDRESAMGKLKAMVSAIRSLEGSIW